MKKHIKINLTKIKQGISLLLCLSGMLLASCKCNTSSTPPNEIIKNSSPAELHAERHEIVLFCGNPGTGKSALCNSIFQQTIFQSVASFGKGMTQEKKNIPMKV
jgi:predicted GTPase